MPWELPKMRFHEDFKYIVSLPCPHDGKTVREWCAENRIPFTYTTHNLGKPSPTIEYIMTEECHAAWFKLRWL